MRLKRLAVTWLVTFRPPESDVSNDLGLGGGTDGYRIPCREADRECQTAP